MGGQNVQKKANHLKKKRLPLFYIQKPFGDAEKIWTLRDTPKTLGTGKDMPLEISTTTQ